MTTAEAPMTLEKLIDEYDSARGYSLDLIDGLDADQIAWRPNENSSAIGWHLGHQAAVNHFMLRNLTAAEPSFNAAFDALFDSATPEPGRGDLPSLEAILDYRNSVAVSTAAVIQRIAGGNVGAPEQLTLIGQGLLRAVINHEYQHDAWILEVRDTMTESPAPAPSSDRVVSIQGYWMIG